MKKTITFLTTIALFFAINNNLSAQSQRLVLFEEFTNASCGPCAATNPGLKTLLDANATKVVPVKYQTNWPGSDPMNAQNPTQVATRVTYYGVTGVPHGLGDGNVFNDHPGSYTQAMINAEYAVASPFDMLLTHTLSSDYDSVFINLTITCTQALTVTGPMKCHVAILEDEIHFTSAPGSNGEKDFYDVMRKMLPNDQGTDMVSTWNLGETQTITFAVALPTYIYDKSQVAVAAWIQDNANKNVKQASYSSPLPMALDAGASLLSNVPFMLCTTSFTPSVTLKNFGVTTLTSATINYQIDGGTTLTQAWTGSLATGATEVVTLPLVNSTPGTHTYKVFISDPNGATDQNTNNDSKTNTFNIAVSAVVMPLVEGFTGTTFPPAGWILNNPDADAATWTKKSGAGGFGTSTTCAKMDFYNSGTGSLDDLIVAPVDLTSATTPSLTFNVAYARYDATYSDRLKVEVSTDCGANWTSIWDKSGTTLATAPDFASGAFTPSATQWRAETVDLASYIGQANVFVRFHAVSGYGNNCYVDDINIVNNASIAENNSITQGFEIYPNPSNEVSNISFNLTESAKGTISVFNVLGEVIYTNSSVFAQGLNQISIDQTNWPAGIYNASMIINGQVFSGKIILNK